MQNVTVSDFLSELKRKLAAQLYGPPFDRAIISGHLEITATLQELTGTLPRNIDGAFRIVRPTSLSMTSELGRNICKCTLEKTAGVRDGNWRIGTRRWSDFFPDPMRVQVRRANASFLPPNILDRMKRLPNRICAGGEIA